MSSLRPARIVTTLVRLIDGSLAEIDEPSGPPCSCSSCAEAWWRNQTARQSRRLQPVPAVVPQRRGLRVS